MITMEEPDRLPAMKIREREERSCVFGEVVITHAVRTPIGRIGGSLRDIPEKELGRLVLEELLRRSGLAGGEIDHVILGHVRQSSDPSNTARVVALMAGIPESVPAYTVHRQCGSGLQAVMDAAQMIRAGEADIVVAGGTESMSQIPFEIRDSRYAFDAKRREIIDAIPAQEMGAQPAACYGIVTTAQVAANLVHEVSWLAPPADGGGAACEGRPCASPPERPDRHGCARSGGRAGDGHGLEESRLKGAKSIASGYGIIKEEGTWRSSGSW